MSVAHQELLEFAKELADKAREIIRPYYRSSRSSLGISIKDDHSPIVTAADRAVELAMRAMVQKRWPEHGIIGEEFPSVRPDARYLWVFDPIDGTASFSMGKPTFGTLVALFDGDQPLLGIIDQPILDERWIGIAHMPTLFNGSPIKTCPAPSMNSGSLAINAIEHLATSKEYWQRVRALHRQFHVVCHGGDCYNYALLASGHIDVVLEASPDLCDFAAVIPIIVGAGGKITGWSGEKLTRNHKGGILAASSELIHEAALKLIRDLVGDP